MCLEYGAQDLYTGKNELFSDHLPGGNDYGQLGKWTKGICGTEYKFICSRALGAALDINKCPDGENWWSVGQKCYRINAEKHDWHEG